MSEIVSEREMDEKNIQAILEGVLFAMGDSVDPEVMAKALGMEKKEVIRQLQAMQKNWEEQQRGIRLTEIDGSYQMCTAPEVYEYLIRIAKQPKKYVLTEVLMETLSIIAYKQPVTKSEIEKIRGVSCDHAVSSWWSTVWSWSWDAWTLPGGRCSLALRKSFCGASA